MKTYQIDRSNGDTRTAKSMTDALATARRMLGVSRVYRGAEYITDRPVKDDREACNALDIWTARNQASAISDAQAPIVISWAGK